MAQNKENFIELTDLINEETMPNLLRAFEEDPELKAVCTGRDGKIYSLPKKLPLRPEVCGDIFYINKEWLDNLNLAVPTTYEELETVLEKFITEDADNDGDPTNEIAYEDDFVSVRNDGKPCRQLYGTERGRRAGVYACAGKL